MNGKLVSKISGVCLVAIIFFSWGFSVGEYKVFPWSAIEPTKEEIEAFVAGHPEEKTSIGEKLRSEIFNGPDRFLFKYSQPSWEGFAETHSFQPTELFHAQYEKLPVILTNRKSGHYFVYGIYGLSEDGFIPAAILVDTKGQVKRIWRFSFRGEESRGPQRAIISHEGMIISNATRILRAKSWCGDDLWTSTDKVFHHDIQDREKDILLWGNDEIVSVDKVSGKATKIMDMRDIVLANPDHSVLRTRLKDEFKYGEKNENVKFDQKTSLSGKNIKEINIGDNFHQNKVASNDGVSDEFPDDALLVSFRSLDMVAIIDRATSKILWHETFDRQHDPDWLADGFLVYNNRSHFQDSLIEKITFGHSSTILVGNKATFRWYRKISGNQQLYADGSILFQGHEGEAIHVDQAGNIETAIINWFDEGRVTIGRNAYFVTDTEFSKWEGQCH